MTDQSVDSSAKAAKHCDAQRVLTYWALAVFLLAGASLWLFLPVVKKSYLLSAIGIAGFLFLLARVLLRRKDKATVQAARGLVLLATLLAGFSWTGQAMWQQRQALETETRHLLDQGRQQTLFARVTGLPVIKGDSIRFTVESVTEPARRYLLTWYRTEQFPQPGERWRLQVKLKPVHGYANPGGFDYPRWLFRHHYVATGWVQEAQKTAASSSWDLGAWIQRQRGSLREWLQESLIPGSARALLVALSLGDRSELSPDDFAIFRATGTAHLIAISGLHIGLAALVGAALGWVIFWFWPQQRVPRPVLQALLGWFFALAYAALAGFSVATVRALVAVSVLAVAVASRRRLSPWDIWAVALLLVLLFDPLAVLDSGFWLSFTAVAALIAAFSARKSQSVVQSPVKAADQDSQFPKTPRKSRPLQRGMQTIGQLFMAQVAILLGLMPLSVVLFHEIHWLAPLVNFVLIPLVSVTLVPLLGMALLTHALIGGSGLDEWLLRQAHWLAQGLMRGLEPLSRWPAASYWVPALPGWWLALWLLALLAWFFAHQKSRRWLGLAAMVALLGFALWPLSQPEGLVPKHALAETLITKDTTDNHGADPAQAFRVFVLDVGQGLAVLVETAHHRLLYDTGAAFDSGFNLADAVLLPYFRQRGIRSLDALILSHRDNDHAGAAAPLLEHLPVHSLYATFATPLADPVQPCTSPVSWEWDGVRFDVLSPYNLNPYLGNNSSCVLRIGNAMGHVLLTGDVETAVEYRLLQAHKARRLDLDSDVMLVPHHGSSSSSSTAFIEAVNPSLAINASGYFNAFGHPKVDVVSRYRQRGIRWLDTQSSGLIAVHFGANGVSVSQFRRQRSKRIWRLDNLYHMSHQTQHAETQTD